MDHGLVYRFSPLEPHEEEKISQNGMDQLAVLSMQITFILKENKVYQTNMHIYVIVKCTGNKSLRFSIPSDLLS